MYIDATLIEWEGFIYLFPHFSVIWAVVCKMLHDRKMTREIMIVPFWPTQLWYTGVMGIL